MLHLNTHVPYRFWMSLSESHYFCGMDGLTNWDILTAEGMPGSPAWGPGQPEGAYG